MEDKFNLVLDNDEKIIEVFKPNKAKLFFSTIFWSIVTLLFIAVPWIFGVFLDEPGRPVEPWLWILPIVLFVVAILVAFGLTKLYYDKTFYAYTNKRVVIRTGVFGVDYKSLDMRMIGAIDVYVSLFDKIIRKNTGSIRFGSNSSPINAQNGSFGFSHISCPYENYRKIKEYIENYKSEKNEKNEK